MFVREENIENYLSERYTTSFDLAYLYNDLNNTPFLQNYTVIYVWCYHSGAHEFLMLHLTCPNTNTNSTKKDIWMRMEREPRFPRAISPPLSQSFPPNDTYSMNYDYGVAMKGQTQGMRAMAALGQLSGVSISHLVELASIIREVSGEWRTLDTSSRWFCTVTLCALKDRFGGIWMLGGEDGILDFRTAGSPAKLVRDRYCSKTQDHHEIMAAPNDGDPAPDTGLDYISKLKRKFGLLHQSTKNKGTLGSSLISGIRIPITSLKGLGFTCFMHSALQCLIRIPELEEYFISGLYEHELDYDNLLGMRGQLVNAFAALFTHLDAFPHSSSAKLAARNLEETFGRFAPAFLEQRQHDTQEFLAILLDGLHEDLNRTRIESCNEKPESPEAGADGQDVATKAWEGYKQRNDSIIVDLFQGMYKSTLVCLGCQKVSTTFDPFMYLTLPLAITEIWQHVVHYVPWDITKPPLAINIEVPKGSSYGYLKKMLGRWFGVDPKYLLAAEIWSRKFYKFYDDHLNFTELAPKDVLVVYELPVPIQSIAKTPPPSSDLSSGAKPETPEVNPNAPLLIPVFHFEEKGSVAFGVPFFILLTPAKASTQDGVRSAVVERYERWTTKKGDLWRYCGQSPSGGSKDEDGAFEIIGPQAFLFDLKLFNSTTTTGIETGFNINASSAKWVDWNSRVQIMKPESSLSDPGRQDGNTSLVGKKTLILDPLVKPNDALICVWPQTMQSHFFGPESSLFDSREEFVPPGAQAVHSAQTNSDPNKRAINIETCLNEFTKEEKLDEGNQWYCFDDDKVVKCKSEDLVNENAYILFYRKRTEQGG